MPQENVERGQPNDQNRAHYQEVIDRADSLMRLSGCAQDFRLRVLLQMVQLHARKLLDAG